MHTSPMSFELHQLLSLSNIANEGKTMYLTFLNIPWICDVHQEWSEPSRDPSRV